MKKPMATNKLESVDIFNKIREHLEQHWDGKYELAGNFVAKVNDHEVSIRCLRKRDDFYVIDGQKHSQFEFLTFLYCQIKIRNELDTKSEEIGFKLDI